MEVLIKKVMSIKILMKSNVILFPLKIWEQYKNIYYGDFSIWNTDRENRDNEFREK